MKNSKIEWTHHTFNPWWGCEKVSSGCANCYAETLANRFDDNLWGRKSERRFFSDKHWNEPLKWNREAEAAGERRRVFCASMADVFEDRDDLVHERKRLVKLITATPWLDWLLLTKRPENIKRLMHDAVAPRLKMRGWDFRVDFPNIWLGTSAEDQFYWDLRLMLLSEIPAMVRFASAEPLLGPIVMGLLKPTWVIVGGESGPGARPMDSDWVRSLRDQCAETQFTSFFFKQWGGKNKHETGRELDGRTWDEIPQPYHPIKR